MKLHIPEETIEELVLASGLIGKRELAQARANADRLGQPLLDALFARDVVTEEYFTELLGPRIHVPIVNLEQRALEGKVVERIPEAYAKANNVVLFDLDEQGGMGKIAMLDPLDYDTIEFLRAKLGVWLEPHLTFPESLRFGFKHYKKEIGEDFNKIISQNVKELLATSGKTDITKLAEAVPIVTILDSVIEHAVALNASDIHFEQLEKTVLVRFRIDGILQEMLSLHASIAPVLVARVKVLANLKIDEHRAPQDGRFRHGEEDDPIDVRVSVMPTMRGEKVEMRLLRSISRSMSLAELGLMADSGRLVEEEISKPHGMVLVTGPTGHGKTTTLYAMIQMLNTPEVNIVTIEDPIEYEMERVNQTQVNARAGITFATGLRSMLRQNPDIVMVGEIRDEETADIAVHAALTGHLVLSTLHTNNAPTALPRLIDMGAEPFLLVSTVNVVIAQRLVRRNCSTCIAAVPVTEEQKRLMEAQRTLLDEAHVKSLPKTIYHGQGCDVCGHSGFRGQIGIFEVMRITEGVRTLVQRRASASEIRTQAIKDGMVTMFEDGLRKVQQGTTTIDEILRVVRE